MLAYRLCGISYPASSGEGAKRFGGRWNPVGIPAVYAAESRALCVLERLVHLVRLPIDEAFTEIHIPDDVSTATVDPCDLPEGWDNPVETSATQLVGGEILADGKAAVIRVPSIVVPGECCVILNPNHPEFKLIRFEPPIPFRYDHRLRRRDPDFPRS